MNLADNNNNTVHQYSAFTRTSQAQSALHTYMQVDKHTPF